MKIKKGFSLLELTLVLGVGTMVAFMKFQDMKNEQESILASAVGQQMKQIGEAVNGYINIRYDKLSTLSNAAGTGTDPGPRSCSGTVCEITYQTLINEGLLPSTFIGVNANKSPYKIILKRDGISPNYVINGLITTSNMWSEGGKTRFDLLGKAMQTAGIDSGMTSSSSTASGYGGQWTETSANFNNITSAGQLSFRVGFNSALYSIYLRRDGTLPMTGDLDMGSNSINNVKDITASGKTTSGTLKSTGDTNVGGNLTVSQTGSFTGNIGVKGMSPNNQPAGYSGGVISPDYYGTGGIYIAKTSTNIPDKNWAFEANREGNLSISGNMNAGGNITSGNWITAYNGYGDAISIGGDSFPGSEGQDYEIKMSSNKTLTIWNTATNSDRSKTILDVWGTQNIAGNLRVSSSSNANGSITASGNITSSGMVSGQYLLSNTTVILGQSCFANGIQAHTQSGIPAYCIDGYWSNIPDNKEDNGGMLLPNGMKIMWGKVSANVYRFQNNVYESDFYRVNPTFVANGTNHSFTKILNVQLTPFDKPNQNQETMWTTDSYNNGFSFVFGALSPGSMSGNYLAIGY